MTKESLRVDNIISLKTFNDFMNFKIFKKLRTPPRLSQDFSAFASKSL